MTDGVRGGFWIDESVEFARMLEADGALDALTLTGGSSFENPMYLFRGDAPVAEMAEMFPRLLQPGVQLFGGRFFKDVSVRGGVLLGLCAPVPRRALDAADPRSAGSTGSRLSKTPSTNGFAFVQMGRALLREPELLVEMQKDPHRESLCIHCNKCMPTIYTTTRCVLVPDER